MKIHSLIVVMNFLISIYLYHPCLSMEEVHVPSLRSLALNASTNQINQHINAINLSEQSLPNKLKLVDAFINKLNLPAHYIKNNDSIQNFIEYAAAKYHQNMQHNSDATIYQSLQNLSCLQAVMEHEINGLLLRAHYTQLPPLHIVAAPAYALCLLNNNIVLAPARKIIDLLHPMDLLQNRFLDHIDQCSTNDIIKLQQQALSELQNDIRNNCTQPEFHKITFNTNHYVNYKSYENSIVPIRHQAIQNISVVYSHDRQKIAFFDGLIIGVQTINSTSQQSPWTLLAPPQTKKICFSADDTALFSMTHDQLFLYDFIKNISNNIDIPGIIAMHPTQDINVLAITIPIHQNPNSCEFELKSIDFQTGIFTQNTYTVDNNVTITDACFSTHGKTIAIGSDSGKIFFIDLKTDTVKSASTNNDEPITKIMFSPDDSFIVAISDHTTVFSWHLPSGYRVINKLCLEVVHTITGTYADNMTQKIDKKICHYLPILLFNIPIDGDHVEIQEFCSQNGSEVWQKTTNPYKLITQQSIAPIVSDLPVNKKHVINHMKEILFLCMQQLHGILKQNSLAISGIITGLLIAYILEKLG